MQGTSWSFTYFVPCLNKECLGLTVTSLIYSRITSTKSPSFCMTTFSASLAKLTALLPQSHDCSCYVSRRILTPPSLWLQKHADLRAQGFEHYANLWRQPRLAKDTCTWTRRNCGINHAIPRHVGGISHLELEENGTRNDMIDLQNAAPAHFHTAVRTGILGSKFFTEMDWQRPSYYLVNLFPSLYNTWVLLPRALKRRYFHFISAHHFARIYREETNLCLQLHPPRL
jgi:hypothetical protein